MPKKDFDYCSKKAEFRKICMADPIKKIFGKMPDGMVIADTAGEYSEEIRATAFWQLLRHGAITSPSQFMGVDDDSKCGKDSIVRLNQMRYGKGCKWEIPCVSDKIESYVAINKEKIGFVSLDLQSLPCNCIRVLVSVLESLRGCGHPYGVGFNAIYSAPHNKSVDLIGDSSVKAAVLREFGRACKMFPSLERALREQVEPMWGYSYPGTGNSATVMACVVFRSAG